MTPQEIAAVFRAEYGRSVAVLVRGLGDIRPGRRRGRRRRRYRAGQRSTAPRPSPAGWSTTADCNRAIDHPRRETVRAHKHAEAALISAPTEPVEEGAVPDTPEPADVESR
ncbi:putative RNA polymerase sigma factor [Streptacidiphilus sp. MAP12-16]|jgi:RNA polymerase sigma-70 factor (ECF subfamily)|uniref:hypothetical protein n=1 Tax=Streptacidiphilus sp. MAP12-16 TaxID=3156300 RepID=UPI003514C693